MILKRTVAPATEPVTLDEAKSHLRVDIDDDNDLINDLIAEARDYLEGATRRAFLTQTWRLSLDAWPQGDEILLPRPPLQSVSSIIYTDSAGSTTTWAASSYQVDSDSEPGRVGLAYGESWPSVTLRPLIPIQITYVAGYGDDAADLPRWVRRALLLLLGHWYENREATIAGTIAREIPLAVESLLWLDRNF